MMMPKKKTEQKQGTNKACALKYCKLLTIIFGSDFEKTVPTHEQEAKDSKKQQCIY